MNTLKFKTNLNCSACVKAVTPSLNAFGKIKSWEVDTNDPDKILSVQTNDDLGDSEIIEMIKDRGFYAERLNS